MVEHNFNFNQSGYSPTNFDFNFGAEGGTYYYVLYNTNIFNSIWADSNASLTNGKFYLAGSNVLHVIDNNNNTVDDFYTNTLYGKSGEKLNSNDIIDIGVNNGI